MRTRTPDARPAAPLCVATGPLPALRTCAAYHGRRLAAPGTGPESATPASCARTRSTASSSRSGSHATSGAGDPARVFDDDESLGCPPEHPRHRHACLAELCVPIHDALDTRRPHDLDPHEARLGRDAENGTPARPVGDQSGTRRGGDSEPAEQRLRRVPERRRRKRRQVRIGGMQPHPRVGSRRIPQDEPGLRGHRVPRGVDEVAQLLTVRSHVETGDRAVAERLPACGPRAGRDRPRARRRAETPPPGRMRRARHPHPPSSRDPPFDHTTTGRRRG